MVVRGGAWWCVVVRGGAWWCVVMKNAESAALKKKPFKIQVVTRG
jgi:hypothetical protein